MLMPVDHDPFGGQHPGVTMDSDLSSMDPYETVKLRSELATRGGYTPEQATQNQAETGMGLLYATPIGNALSARDAMEAKWHAQELERQGDTQGARRAFAQAAASAGSAFLPGMGRLGHGVEGAASSTRIFAGPMAKTANHVALSRAAEMEAQGAKPYEIWYATGWGRAADGKWRFEIDDSASKIADPNHIGGGITTFSKLDHPELSAAYGEPPAIAGTIEPGKRPGGAYFRSQALLHGGVDPAHIEVSAPTSGEARSIALHELQHDVQTKEGFALGSSPRHFELLAANSEGVQRQAREFAEAAAVRAIADQRGLTITDAAQAFAEQAGRQPFGRAPEIAEMHPLPKIREMETRLEELRQQSLDPRGSYWRTAGEVEARNVERRRDWSAERRRFTPPSASEDVPRERQIVPR